MRKIKGGSPLMTIGGKTIIKYPDDTVECIGYVDLDDYGHSKVTFKLKDFQESLKQFNIRMWYNIQDITDNTSIYKWRFCKIDEEK